MIRKILCLFFAVLLISANAQAQEPFVLELRETGNSHYDKGFVEAQLLSALTSTGWNIIPKGTLPKGKYSVLKVSVVLNCNRSSSTVSSSFNRKGSGSSFSSRNTAIYGFLTISATIVTKNNYAATVATNKQDSVSFTQNSRSSFRFKNSRFTLPSVTTDPKLAQEQLQNRLLAQAIPDLVTRLGQCEIPKDYEICEANQEPLRQMKIRLSPLHTQKYTQLGYVEVLRGTNIVRYKIVKVDGEIITIEFNGEPIQEDDILH